MSVESNISDSVALRHLDAPPAIMTNSAASQQGLQLTGQPISKEKALRLIGPSGTDKMGTKMKGLLKGLRYISHIFEPNCKEHEMEIGYPTDVKHVAHIGWDGPSVNNPSWMKGFGNVSDFQSSPGAANESTGAMPSLQGVRCTTTDVQDKPSRGNPATPKQTRRHQSSGNAATADSSKQTRRHLSAVQTSGGPSTESSEATKPSRRHQSSGNAATADSSKQTRRHLSAVETSGGPSTESSEATKPSRRRLGPTETESPTSDSPKVPKQPRHRRPKGQGCTRSSARASKQRLHRWLRPKTTLLNLLKRTN